MLTLSVRIRAVTAGIRNPSVSANSRASRQGVAERSWISRTGVASTTGGWAGAAWTAGECSTGAATDWGTTGCSTTGGRTSGGRTPGGWMTGGRTTGASSEAVAGALGGLSFGDACPGGAIGIIRRCPMVSLRGSRRLFRRMTWGTSWSAAVWDFWAVKSRCAW